MKMEPVVVMAVNVAFMSERTVVHTQYVSFSCMPYS